LASVIVAVYVVPAHRSRLVAGVEEVPGLSQEYVYGAIPPDTDAMAEPSHEPKHRASVELVTAAFSTGGSVIVTEAVDVHPIPSVMATLNDPAHNPIAVGFVWALGSDHKYIKGEVPPDIDAVAWPVHTPKHDKLLSTTADATPPPPRSLTLIMSLTTHPLASVTCTVYEPDGKPVHVEVMQPLFQA
jgi:hypothetical protein